ncbi:hypothetical protein [Psychrilyobacter atlanticus]|uniref:hypothetical protein n=1 Tax=Psychrilyobacter atlanticus TaxID=271091 RepID=UPI0003F80817|nr:hypothetical protein [Psychrilyobacter atlanticus]
MKRTLIKNWDYFRIKTLPDIKKLVLHDVEYTDQVDIQGMYFEAYLQKEAIEFEVERS